MRRVLTTAVLAMLVGAAALPLHADTVIVDNFGPGDTYQTSTSTSFAVGATAIGFESRGASFVVPGTTNYFLSDLRFAANWFAGTNGTLSAALYGGSTDLNTATLLASFGPFTASAQFTPQIFAVTTAPSVVLVAGNTYFVVLSVPNDGSTAWGWQFNSIGQIGNQWRQLNGTPWTENSLSTTPVFEVSGTPVPEPASLLLIASGVGAIGIRVRRRNKK